MGAKLEQKHFISAQKTMDGKVMLFTQRRTSINANDNFSGSYKKSQ